MTDSASLSDAVLQDLQISPGEIVAGDSPGPTGVVTLASRPSTSVDITLSTDRPSVVYVPLTVSIPQGELTGSFDLDTAVVDEPSNATITATLGPARREATLVVYPRANTLAASPIPAAHAAATSALAITPSALGSPAALAGMAATPDSPSPAPPPPLWTPVCQPSFAASLLSTVPVLPFVAMVCIVATYLSSAAQPVLGGIGIALIAGLIAALLTRFVFRGLSAEVANPGAFGELLQRIADIDARLATLETSDAEPGILAAFGRAHVARSLIRDEIEKPGPQWLLGIGYITLWRQVHRAEEALIECDSKAGLLAAALYDELRLTGSDIDNSAELLAKLRLAMAQIDPAAAQLVAPATPAPGTPAQTDPSGVTDGRSARAALSQIRQTVNAFRDDNWAGLVRCRNQLVILLAACGLTTVLLLVVTMSVRTVNGAGMSVADPVLSASVFYLVGAIVGIFNRLFAEASSTTSVDDYGLTLARFGLTPVLAGLAGLGGVLAVALLLSGFGGLQPASTGATHTTPTLAQIFNLDQNLFGIVIAAAFGLTPHLLVSTLQGQADKIAAAITSSNAQANASTS